jgi:N-acetylglutamate synthase-like GNAT family acetyltransferase
MTHTQIEPARPGDLVAIEKLLTLCDLPLEGVRDAATRFLVLRSGPDLIGCSALEVHDRSCVLRSLAVTPKARGRGLGHQLIRATLDLARKAGCTDAYLLTNTIESVAAGHGFRWITREEVPAEALRSKEFAISACASTAIMHLRLEDASPKE